MFEGQLYRIEQGQPAFIFYVSRAIPLLFGWNGVIVEIQNKPNLYFTLNQKSVNQRNNVK